MAFRYSASLCVRGLARSLGSTRAPTSFACSSLTASAGRPRQVAPSWCSSTVRSYASSSSMSKPEVEGRIMDLLKGFDKVKDASKISNGSHFSNDLGLDSLDTVEVVMAIEEEFSIEIPDKDADAIQSVSQAVEYILHQPDAH